MQCYRIQPDKDLKDEILYIRRQNGMDSALIICGVGSLKRAVLRMSHEELKRFEGPLEIVSFQGTISPDGIHVHLAVSDKEGKVWGGHLKRGCLVYTTVELCILPYSGILKREFDPKTGFKELVVD